MKNTSEKGRSMVEMLGTLAIIGILSVGSIVGFRVAMDKHQSNDIVSILNRTTVLTQTQALNETLTIDSLQDTLDQLTSSYLATAVMCSSGYAVNMAGLPKGVCKNLADMADDTYYIEAMQLYIGNDCTPGPVTCHDDDDNSIDFIFDMTTNTDGTAEDAFYYCESNAIKRDGEKVARCQCNDSDVEIQYDSLQEAIDDLCRETLYSCSYNGDYIQRNGDVITNCECTTAGSFKTDEEAIMAMCAPYRCDGPKTIYQGNRFVHWAEKCECESAKGGHYLSDEEAIANMCEVGLDEYWCTHGTLARAGKTVVSNCNCSDGARDYYRSDEEAIANMCQEGEGTITPNPVDPSYYYCNAPELRKALNNGQSAYVTSCACVSGSTAYYASDEEAIAAMCQEGAAETYFCSTDMKIYQGNRVVISGCNCVTYDAVSTYFSDESAIKSMCKYIKYICSNGNLCRNNDGYCFYKSQGCYNCEEGNSAYYYSDEEAIAAMCQEGSLYQCTANNLLVYESTAWSHVTTCNCVGSSTSYDSDEAAIEAMCAERAYYCGSSGLGVEGESIIYGTCNCKATSGYFSSDDEAILKMCQNGYYWCSSGEILVYGHPGVMVTACTCVGAESYYMSESAAISWMCKN